MESINFYSQEKANRYSLGAVVGKHSFFLGFRDVRSFIMHFCAGFLGNAVLDYGCGAGRSTRFLKSLGFTNVIGVDISLPMLSLACSQDMQGTYYQIHGFQSEQKSQSIEFVFSSFVLLELYLMHQLEQWFCEMSRILKPNGWFMCVTGSENLYMSERHYLSYGIQPTFCSAFDAKKSCQVKLSTGDLILQNFLWDKQVLMEKAAQFGLKHVVTASPLGVSQDNIPWKDESQYAPYDIFLFQKKVAAF